MKGIGRIKTFLVYVLCCCMVITSLYPTDLTKVMAADDTTTVYFLNTEGWTDLRAYAYDSSNNALIGAWGDSKATNVEGNWWKVDVPRDVSKKDSQFNIIFFNHGDNNETERSNAYICNTQHLYMTKNDGIAYATALEAEEAVGVSTLREVYSGVKAKGNRIEAEVSDSKNGTSVDKDDKRSGGANVGGSLNGTWLEYNLDFARNASKMNITYSCQNGAGGTLEVYVDEISGTPVGKLDTDGTGTWQDYVDATIDVNIPKGKHKVYLKNVTSKSYTCNLDYFSFESSYENVSARHEAENAHSFTLGGLLGTYSVENSDTFSNGKAIGNINTWPNDGRAYFTTYVRVNRAGEYKLKIAYANATDKNETAYINYRINNSSNEGWKEITAPHTGGWNSVGSIETTVTLKAGINTIDITGAANKWFYDGQPWQWINVDYFELTATDVANYSKEAFNTRDTALTGKLIEAEDYTVCDGKGGSDSGGVVRYNQQADCSNEAYLGHTLKDSWAEYDIYFDRKTSGMNFRYWGNKTAAGKVNVYLDEMSGSPVAVLETESTADGWVYSSYKDVTIDAEIPAGNHKVYLQFVPNEGMKFVSNIDYFSFNYTPEEASGKHEAENVHAYSSDYSIENSKNFSGNEAVGRLNALPKDGLKYLTSYVDVPSDGVYSLVIGYSTSGENTNIGYRINSDVNGEWKQIAAASTTWWDNVKEVKAFVTLKKGINIIDITGACQVENGNVGEQWVNLDYFRLDNDNLAKGKPVYVDSTQNDELVANNAVDGDETTRWASNATGKNGWIYVDLQSLYEIERVDVLFEAAYAKDFEIQFSRDGKTWVTTRTVTNFLNGEKHDNEGPLTYTSDDICLGKARFVKIKVNALQTYHNKLSIYDLKVYGTKVPGYLSDVAVNKEVTANGEKTDYPASDAIDGKDTTRWTIGETVAYPEYTVNLGKVYELHSIDLKFAKAYAEGFTISTSKDGKTWKEVKKATGWTEPGSTTSLVDTDILGYSFHFSPVDAQYVKLYIDKSANTKWGLSIYEFEVWAKDNSKLDYWTSFDPNAMGVYPVTKLQDTIYPGSVDDKDYKKGKIDSTLVSGDILVSGDTYEVVYDSDDRDLYFYVNPWRINVDYDTQSVFWSNGNSGYSLWGADNHDENIARYVTKQQATVYYQLAENLDFGGKDFITTQIGCRIYNNSDLDNGVPKSGVSPVFSTKFNLKIYDAHNIYVEDNLAKNGTLQVKDYSSAKKYTWQKSKDGKTWETVAEKKYDLTVISNNGATVNVAYDQGGGYYYRVKEDGGVWSQPYHVQYYNNVQNGDFEYPAMFSYDEETGESMGKRFPLNANGDEQQYPNGWDGLFWKTTGPGWYNEHNGKKTANDIEIVNGANLKTDREANQQGGFSVSQLDMYGDNSHGNQFAELNCEEQGALYQDILTTPGAECYWDLDHAARRVSGGATNSMLVVAMSTKNALNYTQDTQLDKIVAEANAKGVASISNEYENGVEITLEDGSKATVWKVTSTTTAGQWKHNSGKYTVPVSDENYLTRFFFISIDGTDVGGGMDRTIGNLLDNVTFEQRKAYTIEYYVNGELKHTTTGVVDPYDRVDIPTTIPEVDLSEYTLRETNIMKYKRDSEGNIVYDNNGNPITEPQAYYVDNNDRFLTVAYDHDTLKLYYESGIITLTKRVEGITNLPDNYVVKMSVKDGNTEKYTHTFNKSDFTPIDEADGSTPDRFFATVSFKASDLGFNSGSSYTVTEENVATMIGTSAYLTKVMAGSTENNVSVSDLSKGTASYSDTNFIYRANADNSELFVNTYAPTHKVTLTKKVTGNMGEKEKKTKDFRFTVGIATGTTSVNAILCDNASVTNSQTGKYEFTLKDSESISFIVYDGCTVTVTEQKEKWYSTTYTVDGVDTTVNNGADVDDTANPVVTTNAIKADVDITCVNNSEDLGDVEVQGYQMNTNTAAGAPAEFSPSFRVVCRVSKNTIKRRKVVKAGVIFGTTAAVGTGSQAVSKLVIKNTVTGNESVDLGNGGTASADKDGVDGKIADNIYYHEETTGGYYGEWTTKEDDEHPYTHWNYYALTFYGTSYMYGMLTQDLTYRAYAIVEGTATDYDYIEDGKYYKYEYGNDIYTINMFEIAQNLYENQKMSTKAQHNFLYNNILNVVTMDKNRLQIAQAMMLKLNITKKDHNYNLVNACYKNMYDYIHCLSGYDYSDRGTAVPNKDFVLKNYIVDKDSTSEAYYTELLEKLNASTKTNYETISEWIYTEVDRTHVKNSTEAYYSGFYRMAPYDWNSGIVTDFDEDE
ncbi:carbohydrate-binding protein [uncultured Eubacterium sp.]|uniref:carbohydrate-binding protein n=1 Tax=uncultured Eubacterium sp. TaxID=165185 RepID=UPI002671A879|nr:carbohydrate-binding protein [uncultured Eubacterium sp.]